MTAPAIAPTPAPSRTDPEICHEVHCRADRALCGEDVGTARWADHSEPVSCPMCALTRVCPVCSRVLPALEVTR